MAKKVQRSAYTNQMGSFAQYIALGFMLNVSDPFNYSARWLFSSRLILDDPRRTYALTLLLVQMHWRNKYFHICICMDVSHYHVLAKGKLDFKVFSCSSIQFKAFWIPLSYFWSLVLLSIFENMMLLFINLGHCLPNIIS